jgi:TPR repeat protein
MVRHAFRRVLSLLILAAGMAATVTAVHGQERPRNPAGVAIIIGNKDYRHRDVPPVDFAHNDADAIARWVIDVRGFDPENVKVIKDAGKADLEAVFGTANSERGLAWRLIEPDGSSDLVVYWSGHGVPGLQSGKGYLLPSDVEPQNAELSAYPLQLLYDNLGKLNVKSVTVVLDACFSGQSDNARLVAAASPLVRQASAQAPGGLTVLAAGTADQVASWDRQARHGLFTDRFLRGVYGAADDPEQNQGAVKDGHVTLAELRGYLNREVTRQARREFGREQTPVLRGEDALVLTRFEAGRAPSRPSAAVPVAQRPVRPAPAPAASVPQPAVPVLPAAPDEGAVAEAALGLSIEQRRQVQLWLTTLGYDTRGIDGQIGPATRSAIRQYQREKDVPVTGYLSAVIMDKLQTEGTQSERANANASARRSALARPASSSTPEELKRSCIGKSISWDGVGGTNLFPFRISDEDFSICHRALEANKNDKEIAYVIGLLHLRRGNASDAGVWFRRGVELGSSLSAYQIGELYRLGIGVSKNDNEAIKWYQKSNDMGNPDALIMVGHVLGGSQINSIHFKWEMEAFQRGSIRAIFQIAFYHFYGNGGFQKDLREARRWFQMAVDKGDHHSLAWIGQTYNQEQNWVKEREYFHLAASKGDWYGMTLVARYYLNGWGVDKSIDKYLEWMNKAISAGSSSAASTLAHAYKDGRNVPGNINEAIRLFRLSIEMGGLHSAYTLGQIYESGDGVPKDMREAIRVYRIGGGLNSFGSKRLLELCREGQIAACS